MAKTPPPAATPEPDAPETPAPSRRPVLLYVGIGLVLVAAVAGGGWFAASRFLGHGATGHAEAKSEAKKETPIKATVPVGAVVVNLAGEARRYLKVSVELGVPTAADAKEVEEHKSQIVDLIITILSSKTQETLMADAGRANLKGELLAGVQEHLKLEKVARVYFTEFVVQ